MAIYNPEDIFAFRRGKELFCLHTINEEDYENEIEIITFYNVDKNKIYQCDRTKFLLDPGE